MTMVCHVDDRVRVGITGIIPEVTAVRPIDVGYLKRYTIGRKDIRKYNAYQLIAVTTL